MIQRISALLAMIAASCAGIAATRSLLPGDAGRGRELFRAYNCSYCHSINGEGGRSAPDLGGSVDRGFSPYVLAGLLWNHAPAMWAAMARKGIPRPALSEQQAADLFVYFFAARFFEQPGDARRGRRIFLEKRCGECHGIGSARREGILPAASWKSLADPIALAQQMWNHSRDMRAALDRMEIPYPRLSAQELADLLAYLRGALGQGRASEFSPAPASVAGPNLFASKGCAACHRGTLALEARPTRYGLTEFAASMWNHPSRTQSAPAQLSYDEMRELVGGLVSMQFFEEQGDPEQGRKVFAGKRCGACHDDASTGAPARSTMAGKMTSFDMVAALWMHGPTMLDRMRRSKIGWSRFRGSEMADLAAYLHGTEFRRRNPG